MRFVVVSRRSASVLAWSGAVSALLFGAVLAPWLDFVNGHRDVLHELASTGTMASGFGLIGAVVAGRQPRNPLGWLFVGTALSLALAELSAAYAGYVILTAPEKGLPLGVAAAWMSESVFVPGLAFVLAFIPLLFPTGRLPSPRWRPVLWLAGGGLALASTAILLMPPSPADAVRMVTDRPLDDSGVLPALGMIGYLTIFAVAPLCLASLVLRVRRSHGDERVQIKWACLAGVASVVLLLVANLMAGGVLVDLTQTVAILVFPLGVGVAMIQHRLFDVDVFINRSLVYGTLSAAMMGVYVAVVALAERVAEQAGPSVSVLAVAVVAALALPARELLQRSVNRYVYGRRGDPTGAMLELDAAVAGSNVNADPLMTVAETVARALRLPHVAIKASDGNGGLTTAEHGRAPLGEPHLVPLSHGGEDLGWIAASPRSPNGRLSRADLHVLRHLALQASAIAHGQILTHQAQLARQQLVAAREEERRRLGRDLHDDLGPTLTGAAFELAAARRSLGSDPRRDEARLAALAARIEGAVEEVRRLASELRPPSLDQLGLLGAIEERAASLSQTIRTQLVVDGSLSGLSAGVEVAAFRIVQEALVNVARHARATSCTIELRSADDALTVHVVDDGRGIDQTATKGVGLASMRERAEELGGSFHVHRNDAGGTILRAEIPLGSG